MTSSSEPDYEEVLAFAIALARQAGQVIRESSNKRSQQTSASAVDIKKNRVDRKARRPRVYVGASWLLCDPSGELYHRLSPIVSDTLLSCSFWHGTVVTETDQAVEKLIKDKISSKYPEHKFIGEESFAGGERVDLTDAPTWIVDPIGESTGARTVNCMSSFGADMAGSHRL